VADVVGALVRLLDEPGAVGQVFNVGSQDEISIFDLAHRIIDRAGSPSRVQLVSYEAAYPTGFEDMRRRVPDITKVNELIGWEPTRSLDDILDAAIAEARAELRSGAGQASSRST
jgi:UDP-glucose 4-epimerase